MALLRAEPRDIVGEDLDVLVLERLGGGGHVAVKVGALFRLELAQLRKQVVVLLARYARDVLLPAQRRTVALHAVELLGELGPGFRVLGRSLVSGRRSLLLGEVGGKLVHLLVRELLRHGRHLRVLAIALAKLVELRGNHLLWLAGERRIRRDHRVAVGAVAGGAQLRIGRERLSAGEKTKRGGPRRRARVAENAVHFFA